MACRRRARPVSLALQLLTMDVEDSAMANRRRQTLQLPDPTTVTETAIDAGVRAVEVTTAVARGLARGAIAAARAMTDSGVQVTRETTEDATQITRSAAARAKRAAPRSTPRPRRGPRKTRKTQGRRRRAA